MDEEMIFLDNIMPVEIALKRELEYRRKVEAWRKQQQIDPKIDTLQLEGPPPSLAGTKRKAPPTSSQGSCSKQAFQKQPAGLVCMVCKVSFSNFYYLKKHCESQTHREKLLQMKKWGTPLSNPLMCELCNARCSSEVVLEGHLSGTKHATGLKELESAKLGREGEAKLQIFSEKHWN
ncbi:hypothetical protein RHMOL_Rhmol12G0084000 [Rhododendron molle]|uniref:Uncharacterized protein n=1 Tax=Rhododendron molle TaxID=49168 RepID=A0ACC0LG16_RHOML|nr:hypothetical protein RHMOL_Rhmol12G0084000 [Rhododendron molle]